MKPEPLRRGANRIEISATITREFSEMITRVSLDLVVRRLPISLVPDHSK